MVTGSAGNSGCETLGLVRTAMEITQGSVRVTEAVALAAVTNGGWWLLWSRQRLGSAGVGYGSCKGKDAQGYGSASRDSNGGTGDSVVQGTGSSSGSDGGGRGKDAQGCSELR